MTDTLILSVAGHDYVIPQPPARVGLAQSAAFTIASCRRREVEPPEYAVARFEDRYGQGLHEMDEDALGPDVWDRAQDELTLPDVKRAAMAAHIWIVTGSERAALAVLNPEQADDTVEGDGDPKASTTADEESSTP